MSDIDYKNKFIALTNILEHNLKEINEKEYVPEYGDLTVLNKDGVILKAIGSELLKEIAEDYLGLLETSGAVYEQNGDYAVGIFSSGWCQLMDHASRKLCGNIDNKAALESGKWLCHESCWGCASKPSIINKEITDIECNGGIRLYAVPIIVNDEAVGSINFGYGNPPNDEKTLTELSGKFNISYEKLKETAEQYIQRPEIIIRIAKKRIQFAAKYIGLLIEMYLNNQEKSQSLDEIEKFHDLLIGREERIIELKETVNALSAELGKREPFDLSFVNDIQ